MGDRSRSSGPKVLVVDDHLVSREFTTAALRDAGALVKQADSAAVALRAAELRAVGGGGGQGDEDRDLRSAARGVAAHGARLMVIASSWSPSAGRAWM